MIGSAIESKNPKLRKVASLKRQHLIIKFIMTLCSIDLSLEVKAQDIYWYQGQGCGDCGRHQTPEELCAAR